MNNNIHNNSGFFFNYYVYCWDVKIKSCFRSELLDLKAGAHDFYSNSKKLLKRINISMNGNNAREKIGSCERTFKKAID